MIGYAAPAAGAWFMPVIAGAAVADSVNPCAFSVLFLSIAFLMSLGRERRYILAAGALYIGGIAFAYMLIGIGILKTLSIFAIPNALGKIGAALLIAYSLIEIAGILIPSFPLKLKMPEKSHGRIAALVHKGTKPAAFLLGIFVGICEFPCTGGPYLFVLSLLHDKASFWNGLGYLAIYNAIFVLPLAVILILSTNRKVLDKVEAVRKSESPRARLFLNAFLLALGALLFAFL